MTEHLDISVLTQRSHVLVRIQGECDFTTAQHLREALIDQTQGGTPLVVADLADLSFMDMAGVHALRDARAALARKQQQLVLSSPQNIVTKVLKLTSTEQLIPIYPSLNDALSAN